MTTAEGTRLEENRRRTKHWHRWGPYLSERQWGTVREDYSATGEAWDYFPHDHARSRAYRWGEDGLLGVSDNHQRLCFALALWNGQDAILKERMFGLTGAEGNHGEDVKESYHYLDNTPTHSYMRGLYRYPQTAFPYGKLLEENRLRGRAEPEYELLDTGVFDGDRYFDVEVEYAKADVDDLLVLVTVTNRGPASAVLHLLPTLWFRNTWTFGETDRDARPALTQVESGGPANGLTAVRARHATLGEMHLLAAPRPLELLFTENETNAARLFPGAPNPAPFQKDGIGRYVVNRERAAVNPARTGTKAAFYYLRTLAPGEAWTVRLRLGRPPTPGLVAADPLGNAFDETFAARRREADEFYAQLAPAALTDEERRVQRQAFAGLLWNKQFYHYVVERWLAGDPGQPPPPDARADRAQRRLAPPLQRRHPLHARHLGVPLVRLVGPGLPHPAPGPGGPRVRQASARAPDPGVVHAPQRTDPRLRVGLRRREPARPRLGRLARVHH